MTTRPNLKSQTSARPELKVKLLRYGIGAILLGGLLALGFWLYFQFGNPQDSQAAGAGSPPANDTKAEAEWLTNLYEYESENAEFTNSHATSDPVSGSCFNNGAQNGVWFKFQALYNSATIEIKTGGNKGTIENLEVALLDSNDNEILCSSSTAKGNVTLNPSTLTQDEWYYLLVDTKTSSDTGSFTLHINNVSPTKYYARNDGEWSKTQTWSTTNYNGPPAGSTPSKENVVFVKNINGELKVDGSIAECAGIVLEQGNKESTIKVKSNATLNIFGKFEWTGNGNKALTFDADQSTIYVRDHFSVNKNGGWEKFNVKSKKSDMTIERGLDISHTGGDGVIMEIKDNSTWNIGGDWFTLDQGGNFGLELIVKKSDLTIDGNCTMEMNGNSNGYEAKFEDNVNVDIGGDFDLLRKGGNTTWEVMLKKNVNCNVAGNVNFLKTGGNNEIEVKIDDNSYIEAGGDFTVHYSNLGSGHGIYVDVAKNNGPAHIKAGGDFGFGTATSGWTSTGVNFYGNSYLEVGGDVTAVDVSGALKFNNNSSILKLTGSSTQNVTGETSSGGLEVEYTNIEVNNSYDPPAGQFSVVITDNKITLEEELNLIDGIVQTTAANIIILEKNADFVGGSVNSYVSGPLQKKGADDVVFPVGKNDRYAPAGLIDFQNNAPHTEFRVEYFDEAYPDTNTGSNLAHVSEVEYWDIQKINGTPNQKVKVELHWTDGSQSGISNLNDLVIAHYNGSLWESTAPNTASGTVNSGSIITDNKQSNFSPYTFGSSGGGNVLPIDLTSFDANATENNNVMLTWETSREINNDYFTVERSADGSTFEPIGRVQGAGNSDVPLTYELLDEEPISGTNYYRLKQTDYDGQFEYFPVEQVTIEGDATTAGNITIDKIYPNPFSDQLNVSIQAERNHQAEVMLHGMNGQQTHLGGQSIAEGTNTLQFNDLNRLPAGSYVLSIRTPSGNISRKVQKAK